jgi:2-C-methyl-D-erythritol 4-phosphate cytidylyltransferase/2-C-methyl-D-erythritol 2,4-cyclodiphosphate synthase
MNVAALIVAAGKGERAGSPLPKQYSHVSGKSLIAHAVDSFRSHPGISGVFIVHGENQSNLLKVALAGRQVDGVVLGGLERQNSVFAGLTCLSERGDIQAVLIHDAARPFIPMVVVDRLIDALADVDGAVPVLPVVDTLARSHANLVGAVVDRSDLVRVQTPQAFRLASIMTSHMNWTGGVATDDAQMARAAGFNVAMVTGDAMLDKITLPQDFKLAETRMASGMIVRTGMGFDVHRLEAGEELWLGGVQIPHELGLSGHSDADVALHAIVDAVLGAIAEGDIGSHFPPSDPAWKGARSSQFVQHACNLVRNKGGIIDHIDVTIMCEAPKIGPHRDAMRSAIADMAGIGLKNVSVKATTTERLGFTGRGEGIAAQAIATVRLPE